MPSQKSLTKYNNAEKTRHPFSTAICRINLKTLASNILKLRQFAEKKARKKLKFLLPVKGNAYGSGLVPVAKFADQQKLCDYFGVAHLTEAYKLKKAAIKTPIIILSQPCFEKDHIAQIVKNNFEPTVSDIQLLQALQKEADRQHKTVNIHFKIDTGMGRLGAFPRNIPKLISQIKKCQNLCLKSVMTHFSTADAQNSKQSAYTKQQIQIFKKLKTEITAALKNKHLLFHAANSAATLAHPESLFDMIRPGIATYGYPEPSQNALKIGLKPVMQIISRISLIKEYPKGSSIGYGRTYITKKTERIAIVPVGYADGLNRALSNKLTPIVNGRKMKCVGRISMDQFTLRVDRETRLGDQVTIIGAGYTAADIAKQINTIPYEIICNLGNSARFRHEYYYQEE